MKVEVNSVICIFSIIEGKVNILVKDNNILKYKIKDNFIKSNKEYLNNNIHIDDCNLFQTYTFSNLKNGLLTIDTLYVGIVNYSSINTINNELKFVDINKLNKDKYIEKAINKFKELITLNSVIKKIYPGEFSLPELQKFYEEVLDTKYDRRNFRKKLINLDAIELVDKVNYGKNGRPSKLYKFKEINNDKILF